MTYTQTKQKVYDILLEVGKGSKSPEEALPEMVKFITPNGYRSKDSGDFRDRETEPK